MRTPSDNDTPVFFRRRDLLALAALLLAAGILFAVFSWGRGDGGTAVVTVAQRNAVTGLPEGESRVFEVPLAQDALIPIEDAALPATLEVQDGRIRFVGSVCPDHLCENTGWLSQEGDEAICLPAGVWVRVVK